MKYFFAAIVLFLYFFTPLNCIRLYGQQRTVQSKNALTAGPANYTFFTAPVIDKSAEALQNNAGFEDHPELGMLYAETPCDNCYELIGKRTEISKTFIKEGTGGKSIMQQTSNAAMHYKDAYGNWLTIHAQLQPAANGIYAATEQPAPVTINTAMRFSSLGKAGENFRFNNSLELVYAKPDGSRQSLGIADWTHYTAGDDGVYVTNAWPGIDIEMHTVRGAVKTNFWIQQAMPAYSDGQLLVRDHLEMEPGWTLYARGQAQYTGNLEVRNNAGEKVYAISAATAFEKGDIKGSLQMLPYTINGNVLDIALPGDFLNRPASAYPVIIDPLVSAATGSTVNGSTYSPAWTTGCVYTNAATVPAKVTVTDVQFNFQYVTSGGALLNNGAFDFYLGACRSPTPATLYWNCNSVLTGTCTGTAASIMPSIASCMAGPRCTSYDLDLTMDFYQNYLTTPACSSTYITASSPLTITVFGNTVETSAITASPSTICQGQSTTLSATSSYGVMPYTFVWSPGGLSGSPVTASPTATTTYTVTSTDACGGTSTATATVNVNPAAPISGLTTVCPGGTTTLSDASAGGTWSSGNTGIATINASGLVTGVATGSVVISYNTVSGCTITAIVTVTSPVAAITGITRDCEASSVTLSDGTAGGTWTTGNAGVATVNATTGVVIGVAAGSAIITYNIGGGCFATTTMSIDPLSAITAPSTVCLGGTATLSDAVSGGTWVSTNTSVAEIGSASGIVSGISAGPATIIYTTIAGCSATTSISVIVMTPITGTRTMCAGYGTTLSDATGGGTWSSGNTAVATVGAGNGVVSGVSGGTALITYSTPGGCAVTAIVTVNAAAAITGNAVVCTGGTSVLSDATGGGTWSSISPAVASVGGTTGLVSGGVVGVTPIIYTTAAGCTATITVTVNTPTPISGDRSLCQGGITTLSDPTAGGAWSSSNTGVAPVGAATGIVSGGTAGTATITYSSPGNCSMSAVVTVNPLSSIFGTTLVCTGGTVTLGYAATGGTWSSSNAGIATISTTGAVTGISVGAAAISYTTAAGCVATIAVTVDLPTPIIGATSVCEGNTTTLSNATSGGVWSSSNTGIATAGISTGVATGVAPGTTTITYNTAGGCSSTTTVTVNPLATVTGTAAICAGSVTTLSNAISGGTWSSLNTAIATVNAATGQVSGALAGVATIRYTNSSGCTANFIMTVNVQPTAISGSTLVCSTTTMGDAVSGGAWVSGNTAIAAINASTGIVTAEAQGTATITYTMPGGCNVTTLLTVDPLQPITGTASVCQGSSTMLHYPSTGGAWSSLNTAVATVDAATGEVTGVSAGTAVIRYTTASGCIATLTVTVNALLSITGNTTVCQGSTTALSDAAGSGAWSSTNTATGSVNAATGMVTGISAGTATISYITAAGCTAAVTVVVNPLAPVTGITSMCAGNSTTLNDATPGGTWSSINTTVATADATGMVTGTSAGTSTIEYTTAQGCIAMAIVTVHPYPSAITGTTAVCVGNTAVLSDALGGGAWISGNTLVATINNATGALTGISAGSAEITYTTAGGCFVSAVVIINPLPSAITGTASVCQGGAVTLTDSTNGGSWSSGNTAVASIDDPALGGITGVSAGTASITYTTPAGCPAVTIFTVDPLPAAITGITTVCAGGSSTLHDALAGGAWSSSNTLIATMAAATGLLTGVSAGTATISYITPFGCYAVTGAIVNPTPVITGSETTHPTHCTTTDGAITLTGLTPGETYTVTYTFAGAITTISITADGTGQVVIPGLAAGAYTDISVTTMAGCRSNVVAGPVLLTLPASPPAPVAGNNTPLCAGNEIALTATDAMAGVTYSWYGPGGFTSPLQDPGISASVVSESGIYTVTATYLGCVSAPATTEVVIHPVPDIANVSFTNPATCKGTDGTITLAGLAAGVSYSVTYSFNGTPVAATITADGSGNVVIAGLPSGTYSDISVSSFTCLSNIAGPVILADPLPPPAPALGNNGPLCSGKTLQLTAADAVTGLIYDWTGPDGFSADVQNPQIPNVSMADSGLYSLTITHLNCPASASENVIIHPPVTLTNVTASQTIAYGSSKQLTASGALYYLWWPDDGSLSNVNIYDPVATPTDSITYILEGVNEWGCADTAIVSLNIDFNIDEFVPTAFTPNGDGRNDVFRIVNAQHDKLIDFSVFNRWGQLIYHNTNDITQGWDGTFNGVRQDIGTYYYNIIVAEPDGKNKDFKGDVTLLR